jgi:hypothetical protein
MKQKLLVPSHIQEHAYTFDPVRWKCADYDQFEKYGTFHYIIFKDKNTGRFLSIIYGRYPIGPFDDLQEAMESTIAFVERKFKKYK